MTTVTQIITDAFRQSNLIALGVSPTTAQQDEALRYLQRIVKSVFGNEAGEQLSAFPIGSKSISRPSGYPFWDGIPDQDWYVPKNTRVMLNLTYSVPLYLTPQPDDGTRFAVIDVSNNLETYPVVLHGNGALIEGQTQTTLNINGFDAEWFYRADLGEWKRYAPITLIDTFPFPEEFDDFFITMLALRLNPAYGATIDDQSQLVLNRARSQLRSRYTQSLTQRSELGLIRAAKVSADRDAWGNQWAFYQPNDMFNKGWPF